MARRRTYARDSRGRFAATGTANLTTTLRGAPKRLTFDVNYHGTGHEAAAAIKRTGWRESNEHALRGPGVYVARDRKEAMGYAVDKASWGVPDYKTGNHRKLEPALVRVRTLRGSKKVSTAENYLSAREDAVRSAGKAMFYPLGDGRPTVLPKALADRMTDRRQGVVTGSNLRRPRRRRKP